MPDEKFATVIGDFQRPAKPRFAPPYRGLAIFQIIGPTNSICLRQFDLPAPIRSKNPCCHFWMIFQGTFVCQIGNIANSGYFGVHMTIPKMTARCFWYY